MRYKQFWPGDQVVTIADDEGVPSGTVGRVASRWLGTEYLVRLADGRYQWLNSAEFGPTNLSTTRRIEEGDIGEVTSVEHQHALVELGDMFKVHKIIYDVDYYGVLIDNELKWFTGFQLANYTPPTAR